MYLSEVEAAAIDQRIARLESRTGVQVVTAVVGKSDSYAELPWKAFALGAALAGLAVVGADVARPQWVTAHTALVGAVGILGAGAMFALLAVFSPHFARLYLHEDRRDVEVGQYADSLFLRHELFGTRARTGVLVLISLFERRIEIRPDTGLHASIGQTEWDAVIAPMTSRLRDASPARAFEDGLAALEDLLVAKGFQPGDGVDQLPNRPIEERGE
ncbi:MAG: TPM domain-containing protein [Acidobacteriota bacterium]